MTRSTGYLSYFAATVLPRAAMFGLMIVLTRWFPMAEYGLFVLVITVGEILDAVLSNWIRIFALRTESARGALRPVRLGRLLLLCGGAALAGAVLAGPIAAVTVPERLDAFWLALFAYVAGLALVRLALLLLQIADRHRAYAVVEGIRAVGVVVTAIAAADIWSDSFLPASLALSLTSGAVALASLLDTLRRNARPRFVLAGYRAALRFALPLMAVAVLTWVLTWFDRLVINHLLGAAAVGVYAAAYAIGRQPIELLVAPLNTYTFPRLVQVYETEGLEGAGRFQAGMLVTIVMLGAGAAAFLGQMAQPLAEFLLPPAYHADVHLLLPAIVIGAVMIVVKYAVFDNSFFTLHRNDLQLWAMAVPSGIGLVTSIALISWLGIDGAALSLVLTATLSCASSVLVSRKVLPFRLPLDRLVLVGAAVLLASAVLETVHRLLKDAPPLLELSVGGVAYVVTYALALAAFGFSLRGVVLAPWDQAGASAVRSTLVPGAGGRA